MAQTPNTKVKGTVTVEFSKKNGRQIPIIRTYRHGKVYRGAGKRTEQSGTVIGLTAQQITLDYTTPTPGPWIISRTDNGTVIKNGTLTLGATNVTIDFNVPPGQQVNA